MDSMTADARQTLEQYASLKTIPAYLSIVFTLLTLYSFGGISQFQLTWLDWTVSAQAAMLGSLIVFMIAFMSSETKEFNRYAQWEQMVIAAGPALILLHGFVGEVEQMFAGNQTIQIVGFLIVLVSWGVATR